MTLKTWGAVLAVVTLPFVFEATMGCSFTHGAAPVNPNSYMCACDCEPGERHRELRIIFGDEDAEQTLDTSMILFDPDLDFLNGRYVGLRFQDVGIPQGSQVLHARVQFTATLGSIAGPLTIHIAGEATDYSQDFSTTPGDISARPTTVAAADWNPPDWTAGDQGSDELTPDLAPILQEILDRPGWVEGATLGLIFKGTAGSGLRRAYTFDANPALSAVLSVDYLEASPSLVTVRNLQICMPQQFNIDEGGTAPTDPQLMDDCSGRVQGTLSGLAMECHYPSQCTCNLVTDAQGKAMQQWSAVCDDNGGVCTPNAVDCTHFKDATSFPGAQPDQAVCTANSPLGAHAFERRTECAVAGTAHVGVGDDSQDSHTTGTVEFVGDDNCPGSSCAVGMDYNMHIDPMTFGNFFESETFSDLAGLGETGAGNEVTLSSGAGSFAPGATAVSAQGRRGSDLKGLATTNQEPVNVNVGWGSATPMCAVDGTVAGSVDPEAKQCDTGPFAGNFCQDDSQCADPSCSSGECNCVSLNQQSLALTLDVTGPIVNQPPTADAGPDQTVECTNAALNNIVLDASRSSDPDGNIVLYSWLRGSVDGPEVGFDEMSKVVQSLGSQTYVLHVIDAFAQVGTDTIAVNVVDTTPPVLSCIVGRPVLNQNNHDLVNVGLMADAQDQCDGTLPVTVNVFGDEDDEANTGDGRFSPDATDLAVGTLRLRAERKGNGDGRVYLIIAEATDASGNRGFNCCTVGVPLSSAQAALTSVQNQAAAAKAFCLANNGTAPAGYFVIGDGPVLGPKQ